MGMTEEGMKLVLKMVGFDAIQDATKKMEELNQQGAETAAALGRGELSAKEAEAEFKLLAGSMKSVEGTMRDLAKAAAELDREERDAARAGEDLAKATRAAADADRELNAALRDDAISETRRKLASLEAELEAVTLAERKGYISHDAYKDAEVRIGNEALLARQKLAGLEKEVRDVAAAEAAATGNATAYASAQGKATTATGAGAGGMKNFGQSLFIASQGLEDLQYGVGGVVNNIPYLVTSLGGGMGLAAAFSVTAVAANQLVKHWGELTGALGSGAPVEAASDIKRLEDRIKELNDQKIKFATDLHELDVAETQLKRLKDAQSEYNALQGRQSAEERASGQAVDQLFGEAGAPELTSRLRAKYIEEQTALSEQGGKLKEESDAQAAAEAEVKQLQEIIATTQSSEESDLAATQLGEARKRLTESQERAKKARQAIRDNAGTHVGERIRGAREGVGEYQDSQREGLARELTGIGEDTLAGTISIQTPEYYRRQARAKADYERVLKQAKEKEAREKGDATARQAEVSRHAGIFGANQGLGGDIETTLRGQIIGGTTDPETLREAARARTEEQLARSGMVPPNLVHDVTTAVLNRAVEKLVAELLGQNLDIRQAARDAQAAAEAKLKEKADAGADRERRGADRERRAAPRRQAAAEVEHVAGLIQGDQQLTRGVRFTGPQATAAARRAVAAFDAAGEAGLDPMVQQRAMQDAVDQVLGQMQAALQGRRRRPVGGGLQSVAPSPMPDVSGIVAGAQQNTALAAQIGGMNAAQAAALHAENIRVQSLLSSLVRRGQQMQPTALSSGSFP